MPVSIPCNSDDKENGKIAMAYCNVIFWSGVAKCIRRFIETLLAAGISDYIVTMYMENLAVCWSIVSPEHCQHLFYTRAAKFT